MRTALLAALAVALPAPDSALPAAAAGDDDERPATWRRLIDWCVDGVMRARPVAFERVLRGHAVPEACG